MIPWKHETPRTTAEATITIGPCHLSVRDHEGSASKRWQWCMISLGEFSEAPLSECLESWPKRAVKLARQAVSDLDRRLREIDE